MLCCRYTCLTLVKHHQFSYLASSTSLYFYFYTTSTCIFLWIQQKKSYLEEALPSEDEVSNAESKVDEDVEEHLVERLKEMPNPLACLLRKHKMHFSEFGGLGCIKGVEHHIQLKPGVSPVRSRPYKITWEADEFLRAELDR
ncbi:hypothetical protein HMPREF1544_08080 [Mucor circinelloides 1006PhL]|uniref:Uncharacterized protein n=1 Tax=Mucor circinelloides f. circinelloides (strain 1006PhL) TaxID=1220926 RepID=S2J688_MUCC1|nr:hypothetical protein HMPREF1544_08080 [Mucor circinelloides 1006PhL]